MARSGRFDVIVMDLSLPAMSGIDATARISELPGAPAVLVVTMVDDDDTVAAALQAGARGVASARVVRLILIQACQPLGRQGHER